MPSPATNPAKAGHYVNLQTGKVNFYCNCGARAHEITLRFIQSNTDKFALLSSLEVKEWQAGRLTFQPQPQQLGLPFTTEGAPDAQVTA